MTINRIKVTWGPRRESAEECTDRLHTQFVTLAQNFPLLANWYEKGDTREQASSGPRLNECDAGTLLAFTRKGTHKRDYSGTEMPSLGFTSGFWNGGENGVDVSALFTIGLSSDVGELSNNVVFSLPQNLSAIGLDSSEAHEHFLLELVRVWEPDWGAGYSSKSSAIKNRVGVGPFLDKMLWMKKAQSESPFDESVTVKQLENGVLYIK